MPRALAVDQVEKAKERSYQEGVAAGKAQGQSGR